MEKADQEYIRLCLSGQSDAFEDLIAPYQDRVYNALHRLSGNADDASELFQEAMVRVYRGLASYQGDSSFYTWMYRIVLNVAFTHQRRQKSRPRAVDGVTDRLADMPATDDGLDPGHGMEEGETRTLIERELARLPEPYRVVLVLKDVDGLKYEEIAEILDVPIGTVRSRLHRARLDLRDRLKPHLERGAI